MEEEKQRKRPGRQPGKYKKFPVQHGARFTAKQWDAVVALKDRWETSEAEVIRRAVERLAQAEGLE